MFGINFGAAEEAAKSLRKAATDLRAQRSENSAASTITSRKMPTIMASIVYFTSRNGCSR